MTTDSRLFRASLRVLAATAVLFGIGFAVGYRRAVRCEDADCRAWHRPQTAP